MSISKLAYVDPKAKLGAEVTVEPFAYIAADVEVGEGTWIGPHGVLLDGARVGHHCRISPGAVIAGLPQDLKFKGEYTKAIVGNHTVIRECATVNRGTAARGQTIVGDHCLIMAYSHVAHDCELADHVIIGNSTQLAGEVEIDSHAILSGGCLVHQFSRLGKHIMLQGGTRVNKDVPPYVVAGREPIRFCGINVVGLRRRGFTGEQIQEIQKAYRLLYREGLNISQAIGRIESEVLSISARDEIIAFAQQSERGLIAASKEENYYVATNATGQNL